MNANTVGVRPEPPGRYEVGAWHVTSFLFGFSMALVLVWIIAMSARGGRYRGERGR